MSDLNLCTWFSKRELDYCPSHFTVSTHLITAESKQWVLEKLTGRFCLVEYPNYINDNDSQEFWGFGYYPAFENPAEATYFQLIWS